MSSSKSESPITKVIFFQKIFRFAGRTVKDLVIINSVCKDFEETMQAHHTFNLVLYDSIIKKPKDEDSFLMRSINFLSVAPAWIVYQWTIVNENDETQREILKSFLLRQAPYGNEILFRENVSGEDPSTTCELLRHIIDSCVKLGIVKEVLDVFGDDRSFIMFALRRKFSTECFKLLLESCVQHGLDMKKMLEQQDEDGWNCLILAAHFQLNADSIQTSHRPFPFE